MFVTFSETKFNALTANGATSKNEKTCRILTNLLVRGEHTERGRFIKSTSTLAPQRIMQNLKHQLESEQVNLAFLLPALFESFTITNVVKYLHVIEKMVFVFAQKNPASARILRDHLNMHLMQSNESNESNEKKRRLKHNVDSFSAILLAGIKEQAANEIDNLADALQVIFEPEESTVTSMTNYIVQSIEHVDDDDFVRQAGDIIAIFTRSRPDDAKMMIEELNKKRDGLPDEKMKSAIAKFRDIAVQSLQQIDRDVERMQQRQTQIIEKIRNAKRGSLKKDSAFRREFKELAIDLENLRPGSSIKHQQLEQKQPHATEKDIVRCDDCTRWHRFPAILLDGRKQRCAPGCTCQLSSTKFIFMTDVMQLYAYADPAVKKQITPFLMSVIPETVWNIGNVKSVELQFMLVTADKLVGAYAIHSLDRVLEVASAMPVLTADDVDATVLPADGFHALPLGLALDFEPVAALGLATADNIPDVDMIAEEREIYEFDPTIFEAGPPAPIDVSEDSTVTDNAGPKVNRQIIIYDSLKGEISNFLATKELIYTFTLRMTDQRPQGSQRNRDSIDRTWIIERKIKPSAFMIIGTHRDRDGFHSLMQKEITHQKNTDSFVTVADSFDEIVFPSRQRALSRVLLVSPINNVNLNTLSNQDSPDIGRYLTLFSALQDDGFIFQAEDLISTAGVRLFERKYIRKRLVIQAVRTSTGTLFNFRKLAQSNTTQKINTSLPIGTVIKTEEDESILAPTAPLPSMVPLPTEPAAPQPSLPGPLVPETPAAPPPAAAAAFGISRLFRSGSALSLVLAQ